MDRSVQEELEDSRATPKSTRKTVHLKKLQSMNVNAPLQNIRGDCAGKKEMTQYMFDRKNDKWIIKETGEEVTIIHQRYFAKATDGKKYTAEGTDWELFYTKTLSLLIGNEVEVKYWREGEQTVRLKPAKLLVLEGNHIFMSSEATSNLSSLINLRVFIDSDSDVRLSRRVFQDTQENKKNLDQSISNYLEYIKPSYQREIEPTKQTSDIIIPHFGGGFNDHKKEDKKAFDSNIRIACNLIRTHLREQMKKYEEELVQEE